VQSKLRLGSAPNTRPALDVFSPTLRGEVLSVLVGGVNVTGTESWQKAVLTVGVWMDGSRGSGAVVNPAAGPMSFQVPLAMRAGDVDLGKIWFGIQLPEQQANSAGRPATMTKAFHVASAPFELNRLLEHYQAPPGSPGPMQCVTNPQFSPGNAIVVRLQFEPGTVPPALLSTPLRRSALRDLPRFNEWMADISTRMEATREEAGVQLWPGCEGLRSGLSAGEMGPMEDQLPPLKLSYPCLNWLADCDARQMPLALYAYYTQMTVAHSGMTLQQVLALPEGDKAQFLCQTLTWNNDAGSTPYVGDEDLGLCLSFTEGVQIGLVPTENVSTPCGFVTAIADPAEPPTLRTDDVDEAMRAWKKTATAAKSNLGVCDFSTPIRLLQQHATRVQRSILQDDCETVTGLAKQVEAAVRNAPVTRRSLATTKATKKDVDALKTQLAAWPMFQSWGDADYTAMCEWLMDGKELLLSKRLVVAMTVGMASSAAASDAGATNGGEAAPMNGHCFAVGRYLRGDGASPPRCFLMEGTAEIRPIAVPQLNAPSVTTKMVATGPPAVAQAGKPLEAPQTEVKEVKLAMWKFLTALGKSVSASISVLNAKAGEEGNGEGPNRVGWNFGASLAGNRGTTMFLPTLDSAAAVDSYPFYKVINFTGLQVTADGVGCMPVTPMAGNAVAGCAPKDLQRTDMRAIDTGLTAEHGEVCKSILWELNPPIMSDRTILNRVASWAPLPPITEVNAALAEQRKALGIPPCDTGYHYVSMTECPSCPEHVPVLLHAQAALLERANRLNAGKDNIWAWNARLGSGIHTVLEVPNRPFTHTFLMSLTEAKRSMGWPGSVGQ
jgi:hypothetical protein